MARMQIFVLMGMKLPRCRARLCDSAHKTVSYTTPEIHTRRRSRDILHSWKHMPAEIASVRASESDEADVLLYQYERSDGVSFHLQPIASMLNSAMGRYCVFRGKGGGGRDSHLYSNWADLRGDTQYTTRVIGEASAS